MRSRWAFMSVSTSRRIPWAAPAASVRSFARSSRKRLVVCVTALHLNTSGRNARDCRQYDGDRATADQAGYLDKSPTPAGNLATMPLLKIPYPDIDPVVLPIWGPFAIKWYGLAYVAGLVLGWLYIKQLLGRNELWADGKPPFAKPDTDDLFIYVAAGVLLGGRIGHVLFYDPAYYISDPLGVFFLWRGGMSFHGGLIGSIIGAALFARRYNANTWSVLDLCAAAVPIGLFFGRIANFINGELWGRPTSVPWAMVFPHPNAGGLERHPSQLYEAFFEGAVLFAVLWW